MRTWVSVFSTKQLVLEMDIVLSTCFGWTRLFGSSCAIFGKQTHSLGVKRHALTNLRLKYGLP